MEVEIKLEPSEFQIQYFSSVFDANKNEIRHLSYLLKNCFGGFELRRDPIRHFASLLFRKVMRLKNHTTPFFITQSDFWIALASEKNEEDEDESIVTVTCWCRSLFSKRRKRLHN